MFCKNCGKEISAEVAFCPYCGAKTQAEIKPPVDGGATEKAPVINENVQDFLRDFSKNASSVLGEVKSKLSDFAAKASSSLQGNMSSSAGNASAAGNTPSAQTENGTDYLSVSGSETGLPESSAPVSVRIGADKRFSVLHLIVVWVIPLLCVISLAIMAFRCVTGQNFIFGLGEYVYEEVPILRFVDWFFALLYVFVGFLVFRARMSYAHYLRRSGKKLTFSIFMFGVVNLLYGIYFAALTASAWEGIDLMNENTQSNMGIGLFYALIMFVVIAINSRVNADLYE